MDNKIVIDGRARFGSDRPDLDVGESLEQRLTQTARVPYADKPILAGSLGLLASQLNAADPLSGAKRMFEQAGLDSLWEKRKRFIRLPGEQTPLPSQGGEYGSSGATFARLAAAAGELMAPSRSQQSVASEEARAIRFLTQSTSFGPTQLPLSETERSAKTLIDEYGEVLDEAIGTRTRISDLWKLLQDTPIGLRTADADEVEALGSTYGDVARVPQSLLRPMFRDHVVGALFDPSEDSDFGWSNPTIGIGVAAFRLKSRFFVLPDEIADLFQSEFEVDGLLDPDALDWLENIGFDEHGRLPEEDFSSNGEWGWKSAIISVFKHIGLTVQQGESQRPRITLSTWEADGVAALDPENGFECPGYEARIVSSGLTASQLRYINVDGMNTLQTVSERLWDETSPTVRSVVGLIDPSWQWALAHKETNADGWTEDPRSLRLLLGHDCRFFPTIPHAKPKAGPFREGSLAASLFENAREAPPEHSITRTIIERTRLTADSGLALHEAMIADYREALRRI